MAKMHNGEESNLRELRRTPRGEEKSFPQARLPSPGERLKHLRMQAGYRTCEEAVEAMNATVIKKYGLAKARREGLIVAVSTYYQHESGTRGTRGIPVGAAERYAEHYGVQPGYLLYRDMSRFRVPVLGIVGTDGIVLTKRDDDTETVIAPPSEAGGRLTALRIADADLYPTYHVGDYAYYDEGVFEAPIDYKKVIGRECVVQTGSGGMGIYVIVSIAPNGEGVLHKPSGRVRRNILVKRASPILWIKRSADSVVC